MEGRVLAALAAALLAVAFLVILFSRPSSSPSVSDVTGEAPSDGTAGRDDAAPRDAGVTFAVSLNPDLPPGVPAGARPSVTGGFSTPVDREELAEIDGRKRLATRVTILVTDGSGMDEVMTLAASHGAEVVDAVPIAGAYTLRFPHPAESVDELFEWAEALEREDAVAAAFPESLGEPRRGHPEAMGDAGLWAYRRNGARDAWDMIGRLGLRQGPVTVGVVDANIDGDHQDLQPILTSYPTPSDPEDPDHGTQVAGIVGSMRTGVATHPRSAGIQVRFGFTQGCAATANALADVALISPKTLAEGTYDLLEPVVAVNMSFGWDPHLYATAESPWQPGEPVRDEVEKAIISCGRILKKTMESIPNVLFVAVAANEPISPTPSLSVPDGLSLPNLAVVSGTDYSDRRISFAAFGPTVDMAAPALAVTTTLAGGLTGPSDQGNSFAAPQVTGAAALLESVAPGLTASELKNYLTRGAEPLPGEGIGGRLDVCESLLHLLRDRGRDGEDLRCGDRAEYTLGGGLDGYGYVITNARGEETVDSDEDQILDYDVSGSGIPMPPGQRIDLTLMPAAYAARAEAASDLDLSLTHMEDENGARLEGSWGTASAGEMEGCGANGVNESGSGLVRGSGWINLNIPVEEEGTRVVVEISGRWSALSKVEGEPFGYRGKPFSGHRAEQTVTLGIMDYYLDRDAWGDAKATFNRISTMLDSDGKSRFLPTAAAGDGFIFTATFEFGPDDRRTVTLPDGTVREYVVEREPYDNRWHLRSHIGLNVEAETEASAGTCFEAWREAPVTAVDALAEGSADIRVRFWIIPPERNDST